MNIKITSSLFILLLITLSIVLAQQTSTTPSSSTTQSQQSQQSQQQIKDITFTVKHLEDKDTRCTITFRPRLVIGNNNENNGVMTSNDKRKVITTTCSSLTSEQKIAYQEKAEVLTTTITSDLILKDNKPVLSSLPRRILNDSSLQYETIKLHLDATNLNLIGVSHYLTSSPASTGNSKDVYVEISVTTLGQKPAIEPPKTEKEIDEQQQSFIGKYWYFIVPLVLITIINAIMPQGGGEEGGAGAAAAKKK